MHVFIGLGCGSHDCDGQLHHSPCEHFYVKHREQLNVAAHNSCCYLGGLFGPCALTWIMHFNVGVWPLECRRTNDPKMHSPSQIATELKSETAGPKEDSQCDKRLRPNWNMQQTQTTLLKSVISRLTCQCVIVESGMIPQQCTHPYLPDVRQWPKNKIFFIFPLSKVDHLALSVRCFCRFPSLAQMCFPPHHKYLKLFGKLNSVSPDIPRSHRSHRTSNPSAVSVAIFF